MPSGTYEGDEGSRTGPIDVQKIRIVDRCGAGSPGRKNVAVAVARSRVIHGRTSEEAVGRSVVRDDHTVQKNVVRELYGGSCHGDFHLSHDGRKDEEGRCGINVPRRHL